MISLLPFLFAGSVFSQEKPLIKPALVVIDIQNAYLKSIPERDKEVGLYNINAIIELFRKNGFPIIRVYHYDPDYGFSQESEAFQFPTSVKILDADPRVIKTYGDAFNKTDLDKILQEQGSNTLFLCGLSAVGCVLATWIGAQDHDYKAFMVKDAIMSHNTAYTHNVEAMFDAVGYDMVQLVVENSKK